MWITFKRRPINFKRVFRFSFISLAVILSLIPKTAFADYSFVTKWGSYGKANSQFIFPAGLGLDSQGNVYVADEGNHRVQKFDSIGNYLTKWGKLGTANGEFYNSADVVVDSNNYVYVADRWNHNIQKFDSAGNFIKKWGVYGSGNGQFNRPTGLAVDSFNNIYVVELDNHRVQKFDSNGNYLAKWGSYGTAPGKFNGPIDVEVDKSNNVYVVDRWNHRIQKFSSTGTYLTNFGAYGSDNGYFMHPFGIAVDFQNRIYVTDAGNDRIQVFNSAGSYIDKWGSTGTGNGQFESPNDVEVDPFGLVYVTDGVNNRVQVFGQAKAYLPNITRNYAGWNTPLIVQNLENVNANMKAIFFGKTGQTIMAKTIKNLKPKNSWSINPASQTMLGSSFQGSAVIYSHQEAAAVVNEHSSTSSMAYEGIDPTKVMQEVFLPNITRNYAGWTTPFVIQNLGASDASLFVYFYRKGVINYVHKENIASLAPGCSYAINPSKIGILGTFQGSVIIQSDQNISAIVNEHNYGKGQSMSYNGFSFGAKKVSLPNITRNYAGWTTPFIIQNIDTAKTANVSINYYAKGSATPFFPISLVYSIPPGGSLGVNPLKISALGSFQGSVVINSDRNVAAVVNEHSKNDSMAYSGIIYSDTYSYIPNITSNYSGWSTPFVIQNVDTLPGTVDIYFYNTAGQAVKITSIASLSAGSSVGINPKNFPELGRSFKGSVYIKCIHNRKIDVIINEHHISGDAMSYNGFIKGFAPIL